MLELVVIHRPRNGNPLEIDLLPKMGADAQLWSTCLRQILFVSGADWISQQDILAKADEVYQGHQAYQFLLEIICGLRSPLVGETEVQGQFKQFVARMKSECPSFWGVHSHFFQDILAESKRVRSSHLINLGSQSYGSLLRRRLVGSNQVTLIGAGQLVGDLLPWLKKIEKINIFTRRTELAERLRAGFPQLEIAPLAEMTKMKQHQVLVIAAPLQNQRLMELLAGCRVSSIVDLRGECALDPDHLRILGVETYESLQQLMAEIKTDQQKISQKVKSAEQMIQSLAALFLDRVWLRPGGWEDLCG